MPKQQPHFFFAIISNMKYASAHETANDTSGITATMHIDPADHPVVGQEARFFFSFSDPDKLFQLNHCNCTIFLFKGDELIDQHQIEAQSGFSTSLTTAPLYIKTFAEPGDYSIHFTGQPKKGYNFDVFALHFDVPVAKAGEVIASQPSAHTEHVTQNSWQHLLNYNHYGHTIIFGGGLIASIILFISGLLKKRKNRSEPS